MRTFLTLSLIALLSVSCASTADFNKNSFQALGTMAITYDTALKSANDLYQRGLISEEGKNKIIAAANVYQRNHNNAVSAFQTYLTADPADQDAKKQQFILLSNIALKAYSEMLAILTSYNVYGQPVKPWF